MLDLYFQYVVWLNQTLVNSIKWLITNKDAYYVFMCSIPILATIITAMRGQLITSFDGHKEPTTEQIKEAINTLEHDRIMSLAIKCIERGKITQGEYENLYKYLYEPYKKMGGNGTVKRLMKEVDKLEIVPDSYMNNDETLNRIKRGEGLKPIVQCPYILSANEIRRKFENGQRSKSSHRS